MLMGMGIRSLFSPARRQAKREPEASKRAHLAELNAYLVGVRVADSMSAVSVAAIAEDADRQMLWPGGAVRAAEEPPYLQLLDEDGLGAVLELLEVENGQV
jgi:hypothetical protein